VLEHQGNLRLPSPILRQVSSPPTTHSRGAVADGIPAAGVASRSFKALGGGTRPAYSLPTLDLAARCGRRGGRCIRKAGSRRI
jgi:hypothetical protein